MATRSEQATCSAILELNDAHRLDSSELLAGETGNTYNELLDQFGVSDDDPRRDTACKLDGYDFL